MNTKVFQGKVADEVKICSKCNCYQYGKKIFLNLRKKRAIVDTMKKLLNYNTEITNAADIHSSLKKNYLIIFLRKI